MAVHCHGTRRSLPTQVCPDLDDVYPRYRQIGGRLVPIVWTLLRPYERSSTWRVCTASEYVRGHHHAREVVTRRPGLPSAVYEHLGVHLVPGKSREGGVGSAADGVPVSLGAQASIEQRQSPLYALDRCRTSPRIIGRRYSEASMRPTRVHGGRRGGLTHGEMYDDGNSATRPSEAWLDWNHHKVTAVSGTKGYRKDYGQCRRVP
ncbi:hypothetical protein C8Q77DRAFT_1072657 [Trametes polyzona]|nr:hypothetical protein C8Q77DRAFT_1072657 [Trametes polyzona]